MKVFNTLVRGVEWMLVAMLAMMAILVFGNVVLRYVFNSGIVFSEEVSRFLFMWLTLIGALVVMKDHGHLGMNSVISRLGERGQRICRFLADAMTLACCLLLVHGTWLQVIIGMDDHAPVTGIPMGIVQSALLIASIGMSIVLTYRLWRLITGRMTKEELVPSGSSAGE